MRKKDERRFFAITIILIVVGLCYMGLSKYYQNNSNISGQLLDNPQVTVPSEEEQKPEVQKEKVYVNVFFIGQNANKEEVYKAVNREYDETIDGSKIKFAIKSLISGPKSEEIAKGVYTEIPTTTRLISIHETHAEVIINLNSAFEQGGGTESLYKRLYQLIKTAKRNTTKPVYLYIDGNKAEVIGGEGIMITQPLNENSLDG
jgi:spore germination protein GerM